MLTVQIIIGCIISTLQFIATLSVIIVIILVALKKRKNTQNGVGSNGISIDGANHMHQRFHEDAMRMHNHAHETAMHMHNHAHHDAMHLHNQGMSMNDHFNMHMM